MSHPGPRAPLVSSGWRWQSPQVGPRPVLPGRVQPVARVGTLLGQRVDWVRTLAAKGPGPLRQEHVRHQPLNVRVPTLHVIALDTSGSMRSRGRLAWAKGYAASLIQAAARQGDHVALLCFGGRGVELLLPPGPARTAGAVRVRPLGGGGGTPLSVCVSEADRLLQNIRRSQKPFTRACFWLLTDGRTLDNPPAPAVADQVIVVDFDDPRLPLGRCASWAKRWRAEYRLGAQGA